MRKDIRKRKEDERRIAKERIAYLFLQAEKADNYTLKRRYTTLARKIGTKFRVRIPREFKRKFCRKCGAYWIPSKTVQVRLKNQKVIFYCMECGQYTRIPYAKEIKEKRQKKSTQ